METLPDSSHDAAVYDAAMPAAAIAHHGGPAADALLAEVAAREIRRGRRVRGLLMTYPEPAAGCAGKMVLVDIHTQARYLVSQPMGRDSTSCRGDPQGFAQASGVLRAALDEAPELVVVNRFGALEAEGGGFVAELLELLSHGIPVLTAVNERYLDAWRHFSGGAPVLAADAAAIDAWLDAVRPCAAEPAGRA